MKEKILLCLLLPLLVISDKVQVTDLFQSVGVEYKGNIYAGYLGTGVTNKEHFYVFTESQTKSDKLLLYIHGGPGCSALSPLLAEIGPVTTDLYSGVYHLNKYSWNKDINVLYFDSPAGVGFSKTNDPEFHYDDTMTSKAHYASLIEFMETFKEFGFKELYIAGQSYGGVYVPYLVKEIYDHSESTINLIGILIGNGLTDKETDIERSMIDFGTSNGIIAPELKREYNSVCPHFDESDINGFFPRDVTERCNEVRKKIKDKWEGIDIYGIYHQCKPMKNQEIFSFGKGMSYTMSNFNKNKDSNAKIPEVTIWPAYCAHDESVVNFLNSDVVKDKLHVDKSLHWIGCNEKLMYNYNLSDSIEIYKSVLFTKGLRVWFLSGDMDACVSTIGSMRWIQKTGWKLMKEYTQWHCLKQVAGFYQQYENGFTFITVRGGGHMPALDKRPEMKTLLDAFIAGEFKE